MPLPIHWTQQLDRELLRLRADGATWDAIAYAFGVSRNAALGRGRVLASGRAATHSRPPRRTLREPLLKGVTPMRAARRPAAAVDDTPAKPRLGPVERPPLPAGHAVSWGAITAGTLLDGAAYPPWSLDRAAHGERSSAYAAFMAASRCR
jgi:hypothetical protein